MGDVTTEETMRTLILALAAAATLSTFGLAAPASASDARNQACADCVNLSALARGAGITAGKQMTQMTDVSSRHRHHWRHHRHHWRHHYGWGGPRCHTVWRWGRPVKVCRW
jgi:hypothetical protein